VIIDKDEYKEKVLQYIKENDFQELKKDPTNKYKNQLQKNMKK
jgi:hypothetical protein